MQQIVSGIVLHELTQNHQQPLLAMSGCLQVGQIPPIAIEPTVLLAQRTFTGHCWSSKVKA